MSIVKTSAECMMKVCNIGSGKPNVSLGKNLILAFLAGAYIALGGLFAIKVVGNMPIEHWGNITKLVFGAVFPVGLLLVLIAGADLFTGNCMYMPAAVIHRKANFGGLMKSWGISYGGNFLGAIFVVYFLAYASGLFLDLASDGSRPLAAFAVNLANTKCTLPFDVAFYRGIGCNWLVCLAIYLSFAADDGVSKVALIWPPITAFVAIGFEHSVANMAFVPLGILLGNSEVYISNVVNLPALSATWSSFFFNNLIPVTLGNIVGGGLFTAGLYYKANGLNPEKMSEAINNPVPAAAYGELQLETNRQEP